MPPIYVQFLPFQYLQDIWPVSSLVLALGSAGHMEGAQPLCMYAFSLSTLSLTYQGTWPASTRRYLSWDLCLNNEHPPPCAEPLSRCVVSVTLGLPCLPVSSGLNGDVSTGQGELRGYPQVGINSVSTASPESKIRHTANIHTPSCQWNTV